MERRFRYGKFTLAQQFLCFFHFQQPEPSHGRFVECLPKAAMKMIGRHTGMARYGFQREGFTPLIEHKLARRQQSAVQFSSRSSLARVETVDLSMRKPVEGKEVVSEIEKKLLKIVRPMGGACDHLPGQCLNLRG